MRQLALLTGLFFLTGISYSQNPDYRQIKNKPVVVKCTGDGVANDRTCIQTAINSAASGGVVDLPVGTYRLFASSGTELLLIDKPLTFRCSGWGTSLVVDAAVPGTIDVIRVLGPGTGLVIEGCAIVPASGTPARHGINLDATSTYNGERYLAYWTLRKLKINQFGGNGVITTFPTYTDGVFNGTIEQSIIYGGINLTRAGDTIAIRDNLIGGVGPGVYVDLVTGASQLVIDHNAIISCNGSVVIKQGTRSHILRNNIEPASGCAKSTNGTLIDLQGSAGEYIDGSEIVGNFFSGTPAATDYHIRVDYARGTQIVQNNFGPGTALQKGIITTANSYDTFIGPNALHEFDLSNEFFLTDQSTRTITMMPRQGRMVYAAIPSATTPTNFEILSQSFQSASPFSVSKRTAIEGTNYHHFSVLASGHTRIENTDPAGTTNLYMKAATTQSGDLLSILNNDNTPAFIIGQTGSALVGYNAQYLAKDSARTSIPILFLNKDDNYVYVGSYNATATAGGIVFETNGVHTWTMRPGGFMESRGTTFASLPAPVAGYFVYCTNCTVGATCTGGGTGAWAYSNSTTWKCPH